MTGLNSGMEAAGDGGQDRQQRQQRSEHREHRLWKGTGTESQQPPTPRIASLLFLEGEERGDETGKQFERQWLEFPQTWQKSQSYRLMKLRKTQTG